MNPTPAIRLLAEKAASLRASANNAAIQVSRDEKTLSDSRAKLAAYLAAAENCERSIETLREAERRRMLTGG